MIHVQRTWKSGLLYLYIPDPGIVHDEYCSGIQYGTEVSHGINIYRGVKQ